jgi:nucleotidyltransferase/DNA polymerase involved in DNA repair
MNRTRPTTLYLHQPGLLALATSLSRRLEPGQPVAVAEGRFVSDVNLAALEVGVRSGESVTRARRLCPLLLVVTSEEVDAHKLSRRFYDALSDLSPVVEPAGPASAYAELQTEQEAEEGRARLAQLFSNLPPSRLATAPSKLAARTLAESGAASLSSAPVSPLLFPADSKVIERLLRLGLSTFGEVAAIGEGALHYQFGKRVGTTLHRRARGIDDDPLHPLWPPQVISLSQDFTLEPVEGRECLEFWLGKLSRRAASELAKTGKIARKMALTVATERSRRSRSWLTPWPLTGLLEVQQATLRLLALLPPDAPVLGLSLALLDLELPQARSLSLFSPASAESELRLESSKRLLTERYGAKAITTLARIPVSLRDTRRSLAKEAGALA